MLLIKARFEFQELPRLVEFHRDHLFAVIMGLSLKFQI